MRILLDTHAFLWFITADRPASHRAAPHLRDRTPSAASPGPIRSHPDRPGNGEVIPIVSADSAFDAYPIQRLW